MRNMGRLIAAVGLMFVVLAGSTLATVLTDSDGTITPVQTAYATREGSDTISNDYFTVTVWYTSGDDGICHKHAKMSLTEKGKKYEHIGQYGRDTLGQSTYGAYTYTKYFTADRIYYEDPAGGMDTYYTPDSMETTKENCGGLTFKDYYWVGNNNYDTAVATGVITFTLGVKMVYHYTTSIAYDANGGTSAPATTSTSGKSEGSAPTGTDSLTVSSTVPTYEGHDFLGWSRDKSGSPSIEAGSVQQVDKGEDITLYAQWVEKDATLRLMNDDDTVFYTGTVKWGSQAAFPADVPKKTGYTFVGWSATKGSATSEYIGAGGVVLTAETTDLYPVWDKDNVLYSLIFDANEGTGAPETLSVRDKAESHTFVIPEGYPTLDGYGCVGWSITRNGDVAYVAGDEVELGWENPSETLYAAWVPVVTYTVTFEADGASSIPDPVSGQSIEKSIDLTIPEAKPVRGGYEFLGWAEAGSEEAKYQPGATITVSDANTVLHAIWKKVPVTFSVTFRANGGEGDVPVVASITSEESEHSVTIPDVRPSKVGYEFLGWATSNVAETAEYLPGGTIVLKDSAPTMELYAVWKALDVFILSFDANGGENAPDEVIGYGKSECTVTIPTDVPTKADHRFVGWSEGKDGQATVSRASEYTMTSKEATLYAVWEYSTENTFALIFDANKGTGAPTAQPVTVVAPQCVTTIPDTEPSREGFVFLGWSHRSDATSEDYHAGGSITLTAPETTLYAVWKAIVTYTLTFDPNGGENAPGPVSDSSAYGSVELTVPDGIPSKDGSKFLGWSESQTAVQPEVQPGQVLTVTESKTLYAIWNDIVTFTLRFDPNGGESAPSEETGKSDAGYFDFGIPMDVPTKKDSVFKGWALDAESQKAGYQPGMSFRATVRETTLYAIWMPLPSIVFDVKGQTSVLAGGDVSLTVSTAPQSTVTASGATWLTYADGKIEGKAPSTPGDYQIVLKATADGHSETSYAITLNVLAPEDSVMVSLQANGGTVSDPYRFVLAGGKLAEPEDPQRDGFAFLGWYTQSGVKYDFDTPVTGDLVLVAAWGDEQQNGTPAWFVLAIICGILASVLVMRRVL